MKKFILILTVAVLSLNVYSKPWWMGSNGDWTLHSNVDGFTIEAFNNLNSSFEQIGETWVFHNSNVGASITLSNSDFPFYGYLTGTVYFFSHEAGIALSGGPTKWNFHDWSTSSSISSVKLISCGRVIEIGVADPF